VAIRRSPASLALWRHREPRIGVLVLRLCRGLAWLGLAPPFARRVPPWPPWPRLLSSRPGVCSTLFLSSVLPPLPPLDALASMVPCYCCVLLLLPPCPSLCCCFCDHACAAVAMCCAKVTAPAPVCVAAMLCLPWPSSIVVLVLVLSSL
jgi:hypothetical protein